MSEKKQPFDANLPYSMAAASDLGFSAHRWHEQLACHNLQRTRKILHAKDVTSPAFSSSPTCCSFLSVLRNWEQHFQLLQHSIFHGQNYGEGHGEHNWKQISRRKLPAKSKTREVVARNGEGKWDTSVKLLYTDGHDTFVIWIIH